MRVMLVALATLATVSALAQKGPPTWGTPYYCDGDGCPAKYMVDGFEVRVSPTVPDSASYTHLKLGRLLDSIHIEVSELDAAIPQTAMAALRSVGVTFYVVSDVEDEWWPCRDGDVGCYGGSNRRIGLRLDWYISNSRRWQNFTLHEMAHAYHHLVIPGGFHNECIASAYRRSVVDEGKYESVERYHLWSRVEPHNGTVRTRAWAANNALEYFAEGAGSYFGRHNAEPFDRHALWKFDRRAYRIQRAFWNNPHATCPMNQAVRVETPVVQPVGPLSHQRRDGW